MLGKVDDEIVMVAPFTEGRFTEGKYCFVLPKGDPKDPDKPNRKSDADAEFMEETGIDMSILEKRPPLREGGLYGEAKIIERLDNLPPLLYNATEGVPTHTNYDVVIVKNIADLAPYLKGSFKAGKLEREVTAEGLARDGGLPALEDHIAFMRASDEYFPDDIDTPEALLAFVSDEQNAQTIKPALRALRADLEERGCVGDTLPLKFDDKINRGCYFQECAALMTVNEVEEHVREIAKDPIAIKRGYADTMLGNEEMTGQGY